MKSINDAFKFESTIEEKDNVYIPVSDKVKPCEWIAFVLVVVILFTLAVLPILYERNEKKKEQQRRAEMYVTLEDDKQYRDNGMGIRNGCLLVQIVWQLFFIPCYAQLF